MKSNLQLFDRAAAFFFVLLTIVFWYVLSQGAASVVKTYEARFPEEPVAAASSPSASSASTSGTATPASDKSADSESRGSRWSPARTRDVIVLILTLLAAIWAAARAVFPPEDFTAAARPRTRHTDQ